jgi:predicted DNA-binding transcriptional regulator AlpA
MKINQSSKSERLIDRKELSSRWSVSQKTIVRYEKSGKLIPLTLSSSVVRYRLSDIEKIEEDAVDESGGNDQSNSLNLMRTLLKIKEAVGFEGTDLSELPDFCKSIQKK